VSTKRGNLVREVQIIVTGLVLLLLGCCGERFREIEIQDIPVEVTNARTGSVDVESILSSAQHEVWKYLPGAYINAYAFTGRCDALPSTKGKFHYQFIRIDESFPKDRVFGAFVSVNTIHETMYVEFIDYTDLDFRTAGLTFGANEISFDEMTRIAHDYISRSGLSGCDVTINRIGNSWIVRCGAIENFVQECLFKIDPMTGEITPLENEPWSSFRGH